MDKLESLKKFFVDKTYVWLPSDDVIYKYYKIIEIIRYSINNEQEFKVFVLIDSKPYNGPELFPPNEFCSQKVYDIGVKYFNVKLFVYS